ncbi:hypothetical protein B9Q13_05475 [Candidatus Marsarchaeota G2 archaeon ECH_B_SAG-G16]|uniref:Uncharacterized protein n=5 Tax=Candidatus Marsarchaeota TaxID=1978152 RepID=A0A2R6AFK7_9ARCH|nr:MAG: hypothetical protein B9Q01_05005 [Candidatus Marsarchaeota G1 archaeon OSP_D]PSN85170.1 MAG: hypothetical protein B9Q02_07355 [Candidatus Marsarchaeota G1 archaeon BE_D]PSN88699.1 MAG: hypothetical protein B9Q00_04530 [Candidatus Marsarchaeota G1 archaeon OSP_C]PSN92993.1 MAG: hypothetical protein B9P99_02910 [Candidatus Marsarchaeota G1 archaeon OSP_B]PSO04189.1 MAG: hypothetical protein B9Q13_05475 [Candidatus Marsarchaeota G2 archaeon ECH_B_SAG-G16]
MVTLRHFGVCATLISLGLVLLIYAFTLRADVFYSFFDFGLFLLIGGALLFAAKSEAQKEGVIKANTPFVALQKEDLD